MVLSRISVSGKLVLSSLVFTVPIAVMSVFIVTGIRYDIRFNEKEAMGIRYLRPLVELLVRVPAYSRTVASDPAFAQREAERIEAAFGELERSQRNWGADLAVTPEKLDERGRGAAAPESLKAAWDSARKAGGSGAETLAPRIRDLIVHVGDSSNLILDPDLDTYYLMDVALLALPDSIGRLNAEAVRTEGGETERLIFLALHSSVDTARIESSSRTALAEDANFLGTDDRLQKELPESLDRFLAAARNVQDQAARSDEAAYRGAVVSTLDAALEYWLDTADSLERLLRTRIRSHERRLAAAAAAAALATALAYLVVFVVARNLLSQIKGLRLRVSAMAAKDLRPAGDRSSSDELGATAGDLAVLTRELNASLRAFKDAVENMDSSSTEVSRSSSLMSESSGELAAAVEQIAATLVESEELMGSIRRSVERQIDAVERTTDELHASDSGLKAIVASMGGLKALAAEGEEATRSGADSVGSLIERSESLGNRSRELETRIRNIEEASAAIGAMTEAIADIADRTELLAMNASIEAAHAGASGKGFAVVAGAIRELAASTAGALGSIRDRRAAIDEAVAEATASSREAGRIAGDLGTHTDGAKRALDRISETTRQFIEGIDTATEAIRGYERQSAAILSDAVALKDFSGTIRSAVAEQEAGSKETMEAVRSLRETSSRNADESDSLAGLSASLKSAGENLNSVIAQFVLEEASEKGT